MAEEEEEGGRGPGSTQVTGPSVKIESGKGGRVSATLTFNVPEGVNAQTLMAQVATCLRAAFAGNIDSGGDPKFAPLAKSTLRQKKLHGYPTEPLIRTRLLRNSLARSNTGGNVNSVRQGASTVTVGTSVAYAAVQQEGSKRGLPARPFVVVGEKETAAIAGMVARFNAGLRQQQAEVEASSRNARRPPVEE